MIKYKILPEKPKYIHHTSLYSLKSRGTYYGIHKKMIVNNYDPNCSKTSLVLFVEKTHASTFKQFLESQLKVQQTMDRVIDDNYANTPILSKSIQPLIVEKIESKQLEMLCLLHFFNLLIVNKVQRESGNLNVYGYEFVTYDIPNRQILEYNLYKLYHNH